MYVARIFYTLIPFFRGPCVPSKTKTKLVDENTIIPANMIYTLNVARSHKGIIERDSITFTSAVQVAEYIRNYIDQPNIQEILSDIEYVGLGDTMDDFLPTPFDIDAKCDVLGEAIVFMAGECVDNAQEFGVVFKVTRKQGLT